MHEEDKKPPNIKNAYHFSITYNGYDFFLLTYPAIIDLPKYLLKGCHL